jgi:hypothetical protein
MSTLTPPEYKERVLFMGENGSGKSVLARELLSAGYPRYVAIDSKGDFPTREGDVVIKDPQDKRWKSPPDHTIYRPPANFATGPWLSYILHLCYARAQREGKQKPFIVYVDEGYFLSRTGHTQWLAGLAVSGRSMGVGLWVSSQRPRWIPTEVRTEAWRWFIFHLGYDEDEAEVVKYLKLGAGIEAKRRGITMLQEATENFSFIEVSRDPVRAGHRKIRRCPPVAVNK